MDVFNSISGVFATKKVNDNCRVQCIIPFYESFHVMCFVVVKLVIHFSHARANKISNRNISGIQIFITACLLSPMFVELAD